MLLKEFLEKFVVRNTLIRLWLEMGEGGIYGHYMIYKKDNSKPGKVDEVTMEWKILNGDDWRSEYINYEVAGVKDILCPDSLYKEAVNIVIRSK